MNKVTITKENLLKAISEFSLMQSHADYMHFSFEDRNMPDTIEIQIENE